MRAIKRESGPESKTIALPTKHKPKEPTYYLWELCLSSLGHSFKLPGKVRKIRDLSYSLKNNYSIQLHKTKKENNGAQIVHTGLLPK